MSPSKQILSALLLGATLTGVGAQTLDADMISSMGNNTLFTRWRPTSHVLAPAGWMNVRVFESITH